MSNTYHRQGGYYSDGGMSVNRHNNNNNITPISMKNGTTISMSNALSKLSVCVRVRPVILEDKQLANTIRNEPELCIHLKQDGQSIKLLQDKFHAKSFKVDRTFPQSATQSEVYNCTLKPIVREVIKGYNGTGIVYGQTASGKTFTMFGNQQRVGISHYAIEDIFNVVRELEDRNTVAKVFVSFYQIYLEQIYDLLADPVDFRVMPNPLPIRENKDTVYIENLKSIYCRDKESAFEAIAIGLRHRRVHSTNFNLQSSRSHAILEIQLDTEEEPPDNQYDEVKNDGQDQQQHGGIADEMDDDFQYNTEDHLYRQRQIFTKHKILRRKLLIVDLAGSERIPIYRNTNKQQLKESAIINKSISALGNVITALCNNNFNNTFTSATDIMSNSTTQQHIPYRDCKLTRVLATSLGGNSKTCIICTIGPCMYNYEETKSTLKFASRAKVVKKVVKKNTLMTVETPVLIMPEVQQMPLYHDDDQYNDDTGYDSNGYHNYHHQKAGSSNQSVTSGTITTSTTPGMKKYPSFQLANSQGLYNDHLNSSNNTSPQGLLSPTLTQSQRQFQPPSGMSRIPSNNNIIVNSEFVGTRSPRANNNNNNNNDNLPPPPPPPIQDFYDNNFSNKYIPPNHNPHIMYTDANNPYNTTNTSQTNAYLAGSVEPPSILQPLSPHHNTFNVRDFIRACTLAHRLYTPQQQENSHDMDDHPDTNGSHSNSNSIPRGMLNIQPISPPTHRNHNEVTLDSLTGLGMKMIDYDSTPPHGNSPDIFAHQQSNNNNNIDSNNNNNSFLNNRLLSTGSMDGAKHSFHHQSPVMLVGKTAGSPHPQAQQHHGPGLDRDGEDDDIGSQMSSAKSTPNHRNQSNGHSLPSDQTSESVAKRKENSNNKPPTSNTITTNNTVLDNKLAMTPPVVQTTNSHNQYLSTYVESDIKFLLEQRKDHPQASTRLHLLQIAQQSPALIVDQLLRLQQELDKRNEEYLLLQELVLEN